MGVIAYNGCYQGGGYGVPCSQSLNRRLHLAPSATGKCYLGSNQVELILARVIPSFHSKSTENQDCHKHFVGVKLYLADKVVFISY
jgi:hypothetical protein